MNRRCPLPQTVAKAAISSYSCATLMILRNRTAAKPANSAMDCPETTTPRPASWTFSGWKPPVGSRTAPATAGQREQLQSPTAVAFFAAAGDAKYGARSRRRSVGPCRQATVTQNQRSCGRRLVRKGTKGLATQQRASAAKTAGASRASTDRDRRLRLLQALVSKHNHSRASRRIACCK